MNSETDPAALRTNATHEFVGLMCLFDWTVGSSANRLVWSAMLLEDQNVAGVLTIGALSRLHKSLH
ncbi:hypothetical protein ACYZUD_02670 [Pseudomonas sp. XS1P51]